MKKLLDNLANLFKVKTIITLVIIFVFAYLALTNKLPIECTTMVIGSVITYYFNKDAKETKEKEDITINE